MQEEIKETNVVIEEKEITSETKKGWKFPYEERIKKFAKEKPKQAFRIMFGLIILSFFITIGRLIYTQQVLVPQYNQMKSDGIFKKATTSLGAPIEATQKIMEIKDVLKELDYYKNKSVLTKSDSLRIEYLIDKYQKHGAEKN